MKEKKIVLKGQEYATPQTESVEISNQGVLCASGAPAGGGPAVNANMSRGYFG